MAAIIQSLKIHLRGMLVSIPFIIIMLAGGLNCLLWLMFNATEGYGNQHAARHVSGCWT